MGTMDTVMARGLLMPRLATDTVDTATDTVMDTATDTVTSDTDTEVTDTTDTVMDTATDTVTDTVTSDTDTEVTDTMDTDMARGLLMLRLATGTVDMATDTAMEVTATDTA